MDTNALLAAVIAAARQPNSKKAAMNVADFGASILEPQQFNRFVEMAEEKAALLGEARRIPMPRHRVNIDLIGIFDWVITAGQDADGNHRDATDDEGTTPTTKTPQLDARELVAKTGLLDKAARRNIEGVSFEDHLLGLMGGAFAKDLSAYCLLADTDFDYSASRVLAVLSQADGWLKKADNQVFGQDSADGTRVKDFDASAIGTDDYELAGTQAKALFQVMYETIEGRFIDGNEGEFRIYAPRDVYNAYRELWIGRYKNPADSLATGAVPDFLGIPVVRTPELGRHPLGRRNVWLSHPDNHAYGIFHEVTTEPARKPGNRSTDFYMVAEADSGYEDSEGAVVARLDEARPAA